MIGPTRTIIDLETDDEPLPEVSYLIDTDGSRLLDTDNSLLIDG